MGARREQRIDLFLSFYRDVDRRDQNSPGFLEFTYESFDLIVLHAKLLQHIWEIDVGHIAKH